MVLTFKYLVYLTEGCFFAGTFMFLETTEPLKEGDRAWYVSPPIPSADICFTLWYHMYGESTGSLSVKRMHKLSGIVDMWSLSG